MMDRETWLRCILDATRDLADEAYQERVWARGQGPEVDSVTEALVRLLDDYDLPGFLDQASGEGRVSDDQLAALQTLERALEAVRDQGGNDDAVRLSTPEWQAVRERSARVLQAFAARETSA